MEYNIKFKTTAEGSGAQKTAQDIKEVKAAAQETGAAHQEAAKEAERSELSHSKLAGALRRLKHEVPGLALVIDTLKSPYFGAAAAIAAFVRAIYSQIRAQNALAESAAANVAAMTGLEGRLDRSKVNAQNAADATREFAQALDELNKQAGDKDLQEANEQIDKQMQRDKAALEVKKQIALENLKKMKAAGGISDEQEEKEKGRIETFFAGEEEGIERAGRGAKANNLAQSHFRAQEEFKKSKAAREKALVEQGAAKNRLAEFDRLEKEPGGAAEQRAEAMKQERENEKEALKGVAKAQSKLERMKEINKKGGYSIGDVFVNPDLITQPSEKSLQEDLDKEQAKLDAARAAQKSIFASGQAQSDTRDKLAGGVTQADDAVTEATRGAVRAQGRADSSLRGTLALHRENQADTAANAELDSLRGQLAGIRAATAGINEQKKFQEEINRGVEELVTAIISSGSPRKIQQLTEKLEHLKQQFNNLHNK